MDVILRFIDVNVIVRFFIGIFIFLMFLVLRKVITKLIFGLIEKLTKDIKDGFVSNLIGALEKPVANVVIIMGLYVSLNYMGISKVFLNQIIVSAIVLAVAAGLYSLDDYYAKTARLAFTNVNKKTSEVMIQLTVNVIKMLIIVLSFMIVCSEFFDINGFVAGLGITGFAIAFAAQESLASVVAGISIMIDSPFDVGDYIECNGNNGIVENINFRSTRIRTFEKDIRVIPNIILAKEAVINFSER